jgi:hypothetical protein
MIALQFEQFFTKRSKACLSKREVFLAFARPWRASGNRKKQDMSGQERQLTVNSMAFSPVEAPGAVLARPAAAAKQLVPAAVAAAGTSSVAPRAAHTQSPSQVKNHVAQALHETVLQTLVATTYLAESPKTSRQDLVEYLRQATNELHCFIDGLTASETPSTRPSAPMGAFSGP